MPLGNFTNIAVSTSLLFLEELPHTTTCKINYYLKKKSQPQNYKKGNDHTQAINKNNMVY